jgi:UDP-4-amino-4,6-dideoxy-N-acetyl-beta-L-altrosamine transaminase
VIPYGRQDISEQDIDAVLDVLKSDFLTQGPVVPRFESALAEYVGVKYAVAMNSATSALHISCLALGLSEGDYLWTSPISFVASANCGLYCGAKVDFIDIDLDTYNLSLESLARKLEQAEGFGVLPKIIVVVHLAGMSCDMSGVHALSKQYGFSIIEDASHAIGGKYKDEPVGTCRYSDVTVFSFHPVKIITSAEGGVCLSNNIVLNTRMQALRSHGITRDPDEMENPNPEPWHYEQAQLGFNYRMSDIHAALGLNQLKRVDEFVVARQLLRKQYDNALSHLPLILPIQVRDVYSACHLYLVRIDQTKTHFSRRDLFDKLREKGIGVNVHYIPIYRQPFYKKMGFMIEGFPNSEEYYSSVITLPLFPTMSEEDFLYVIESLNSILL